MLTPVRLASLAAGLAVASIALVSLAQDRPAGDASRGKDIFGAKCAKCHGRTDRGPPYTGLFGRRAGTVRGFEYSDALQRAGVVWSEETLERWLRNPDEMVPGNLMATRVKSAQDRADLIAYLRQRN